MTAAASHRRLRCGQTVARHHAEDRVLAVVRGMVRVELLSGLNTAGSAAADEAGPEWLRSSDSLSIPAHTRYTIQALQDTELYLYTDRAATPALWGV